MGVAAVAIPLMYERENKSTLFLQSVVDLVRKREKEREF